MNYVFDLYGTLIDIWTDEGTMNLWKPMSALYSAYGADYTPEELRDAYFRTVQEEEAKLRLRTGLTYPEITLDPVFLRLYDEAPRRHAAAHEPDRAEWVYAAANVFRVLSRKRLGAYPGTIPTLTELRRRGHRLYLLSNAQKIFTLPEMEITGIADKFDAVYISSEHNMRKPQPEFMGLLLEREGLDPAETVMVGNDFSSDMRSAALWGVRGVFLNTDGYSDKEISQMRRSLEDELDAKISVIASGDIGELLGEV